MGTAPGRCDDVLQCLMSLNHLEVQAYKTLVREGPMRADELGQLIGRDRSTAYRCLRRLVSCGMATKDTHTIERGGYYHDYSAVDPAEVKAKLKECTNNWYDRMSRAVEGFPYED